MPNETGTGEARTGEARTGEAQPESAGSGGTSAEDTSTQDAGTENTGAGDADTEDAGAGDADTDGASGGEAPAPVAMPRSRRLLPVILAAAIIVLGAFGVWATVTAHSLRNSAASQNTALTDRAGTAEVSRQISQEVATIFSYSYADTARTRLAAQGLLTGAAIRQYNTLFALVQKEAPAQKLVVTTQVADSGVEFLTGGRARLLIFANQQDTRAGTHQSSYGGAMFAVTAVRQGGRWKIENIDTFTRSG